MVNRRRENLAFWITLAVWAWMIIPIFYLIDGPPVGWLGINVLGFALTTWVLTLGKLYEAVDHVLSTSGRR